MRKLFARMYPPIMVPCFVYLVAALAVSGCAHNYLYNAARDKQGQAATKAASEYKPVDTVTIVEKRFEGLLVLELDAAEKRFANIRELEIREVAFKDGLIKDIFIKRIEDRLAKVQGKADWKNINQLRRAMKQKENLVESRRDGFVDAFLLAAPSCEELINNKGLPKEIDKKIQSTQKEEAAEFVRQTIPRCEEFLANRKNLNDALNPSQGTKLFAAFDQLDSDEKEKKKNDDERKVAEAALKHAIDDYTKEAKKLGKPEDKNSYLTRTTEAARKLQAALGNLEKVQEAVGIEVVAKERLNRIEDVISAVAGGNVDTSKWDEGLRKSVAIAGSLPALADETQKMLLETQRPRLTPLVIAREHQREIVEESEKVDEVLDRRIKASENIVEAYQNELNTLLHIYDQINAENQKPWHSKSLLQLSKDLAPKEKRLLYELLGIYFDDVPRFQRDEQLWEYRRVATFYDETVVRSKYAAIMWQNLIEGVANVLAGYHSTGIKPEDLARLVETLGVLGIGVGVNR